MTIANDKLDPWGQILLLRKMTDLTGVLHEAQVQQLKIWPLLAVPNASSSEFTWDPDMKVVEFVLRLNPKAPFLTADETLMRLQGLDRSVKQMLGDGWHITVSFGKKSVYSSITDRLNDGWNRTRKAKAKRARAKRV